MAPNGWVIKNLEDIVSKSRKITYGIVVPGPNTPNGNLMIRAQDYSFGWKSVDSIYRVSDEVHKSYKRSQVEEGDVLLTIVGSIGKTAVVPKHLSGANLTQQTARLSFSENDGNYFHAVLSSPIGKREVYRFAKSGVQPSLNLSDISKFQIPVPPLPEQRKIAKILGTWDKAISTTERLIDNSKQQKKALMQQLLTGKKRLLDDSGKPFEGEWEEIAAGDLGKIYSGGTPSTTNKAYWDGDIDWITPTDITKQDSVYIKSSVRKISYEGLKNSSAKLVPKGSLLVCTRATIGEMAITAHEMCTNQGFKNIIPNKKTNIEFLFYLLTYQKHKLVSKASGSTFLELSKSAFESMKFRVPIIDEQQKIALVLTNADQEIELLEQQLADLRQEKKALMQQLLTGKRRVKVDDEAVA